MWWMSLSGCVIGVTLPGTTMTETGVAIDSATGGSGTVLTTPPPPPDGCGDGVSAPGEVCLVDYGIWPVDPEPRQVALGVWGSVGVEVLFAADGALGGLDPLTGESWWLPAAPFAGRPTALALGPFDLGPALDLVVGASDAPPSIVPGDSGATVVTIGTGSTRDVAVGELRGSGLLADLAVSTPTDGGVFQSVDGSSSAAWIAPSVAGGSVALAHTAPDHSSYVVATGTTLRIVPLDTDLAGPPVARPEVVFTLPGEALDVLAADFDADGDDDLAVLLEEGLLLRLTSDGADGWIEAGGQPWTTLDLMKGDGGSAGLYGPDVDPPFLSGPPEALEAADFDGDGLPDLVAVAPFRLFFVLLQATVVFETLAGPVFVELLDVAVGDVDGDGDVDLVAAVGTGGVAVLLSDP
jgi:FG-GAP repeat